MINPSNITDKASSTFGRVQTRREALGTAGKLGALFTVPALFANMLRPELMMAQQASLRDHEATPTQILQYALTLEYLEAEFYIQGMRAAGLIPASDRVLFGTIRDHEIAHVRFLENQLGIAEDSAKPTFDFTAGGAFPDVFTNYATFRTLAQAFEDTGVRAYKGQAGSGALVNNGNALALTAALQIHSVEARHAAEVRRLNGNFAETAPQKGWITGSMPGVVPASVGGTAVGSAIYGAANPNDVYPAESNVTQAGVDLTTLTYTPNLAGDKALKISEAFDEPLSMDAVNAVASLFIVS